MTKLFIIVNEDVFFLSHRKDLGVAAHRDGFDVTVVCKDTGLHTDIQSLGLRTINMPINPTGMSLSDEWRTLRFLYHLYRTERPDIVHHVGLKAMLWGGLAARLTHVGGVVNAVSGLGTMFNGNKPSMMARVIMAFLRFSNRRKGVVTIFQNHDDEAIFFDNHIVRSEDSVFIKGSGVDLNNFCFTPLP